MLAYCLSRERTLRSVETRAGHARGRRRKLGFAGVVFRGLGRGCRECVGGFLDLVGLIGNGQLPLTGLRKPRVEVGAPVSPVK